MTTKTYYQKHITAGHITQTLRNNQWVVDYWETEEEEAAYANKRLQSLGVFYRWFEKDTHKCPQNKQIV